MKPNVKMLLLGVLALAFFAMYFFFDFNIGGEKNGLRKADFASLYTMPGADSLNAVPDSAKLAENKDNEVVFNKDSAQNILFIGDSMLEGLCKRFIDYTEQNKHNLQTIIWYSSTSDVWANTDTLQHFLKEYNPSYVVICLGANELFVKDVDVRKENIKKIVKKLGNLPFVWISPPNWKDDTGINDAIISVVGKNRYFDSRYLTLARKKDHAHPTDAAAVTWMDTIARWMKSPQCAYPIHMDWPENDVKSKNVTLLQPYYR